MLLPILMFLVSIRISISFDVSDAELHLADKLRSECKILTGSSVFDTHYTRLWWRHLAVQPGQNLRSNDSLSKDLKSELVLWKRYLSELCPLNTSEDAENIKLLSAELTWDVEPEDIDGPEWKQLLEYTLKNDQLVELLKWQQANGIFSIEAENATLKKINLSSLHPFKLRELTLIDFDHFREKKEPPMTKKWLNYLFKSELEAKRHDLSIRRKLYFLLGFLGPMRIGFERSVKYLESQQALFEDKLNQQFPKDEQKLKLLEIVSAVIHSSIKFRPRESDEFDDVVGKALHLLLPSSSADTSQKVHRTLSELGVQSDIVIDQDLQYFCTFKLNKWEKVNETGLNWRTARFSAVVNQFIESCAKWESLDGKDTQWYVRYTELLLTVGKVLNEKKPSEVIDKVQQANQKLLKPILDVEQQPTNADTEENLEIKLELTETDQKLKTVNQLKPEPSEINQGLDIVEQNDPLKLKLSQANKKIKIVDFPEPEPISTDRNEEMIDHLNSEQFSANQDTEVVNPHEPEKDVEQFDPQSQESNHETQDSDEENQLEPDGLEPKMVNSSSVIKSNGSSKKILWFFGVVGSLTLLTCLTTSWCSFGGGSSVNTTMVNQTAIANVSLITSEPMLSNLDDWWSLMILVLVSLVLCLAVLVACLLWPSEQSPNQRRQPNNNNNIKKRYKLGEKNPKKRPNRTHVSNSSRSDSSPSGKVVSTESTPINSFVSSSVRLPNTVGHSSDANKNKKSPKVPQQQSFITRPKNKMSANRQSPIVANKLMKRSPTIIPRRSTNRKW